MRVFAEPGGQGSEGRTGTLQTFLAQVELATGRDLVRQRHRSPGGGTPAMTDL